MIKYAKLNFPVDTKALQAETKNILTGNEWSAHLNQSHYTGSWEVLPLRSPGGKVERVTADLMSEDDFEDTMLMDVFPAVKDLIETFYCPVMSARLLNLKSGAMIKPHRDHELSFEKGEARIHFPVFTNPLIDFFVDDERIEMKEGESWYINANRMHHVSNRGTTDRIHLVIDCKVNSWLENIFEEAEKVMVDEEVNTGELQKIINELRLQNTETSNKFADQLSKNM